MLEIISCQDSFTSIHYNADCYPHFLAFCLSCRSSVTRQHQTLRSQWGFLVTTTHSQAPCWSTQETGEWGQGHPPIHCFMGVDIQGLWWQHTFLLPQLGHWRASSWKATWTLLEHLARMMTKQEGVDGGYFNAIFNKGPWDHIILILITDLQSASPMCCSPCVRWITTIVTHNLLIPPASQGGKTVTSQWWHLGPHVKAFL